MNYYNDNDPFIVKWLKELISAGLIPKGEVDDRSITDVKPSDLKGFVQCHFFAGIGGWPYALRLAGWPEDRSVWTGSCPCQPFSTAGKGEGIEDERHLWPAFRWLIAQCRPATVFGEQVAGAAGRQWLDGVRLDLEAMGYEVGAADLPAASVGAPHKRNRLFWVGHRKQPGLERHSGNGNRRDKPGRDKAQKDGPVATAGGAGGVANTPCDRRRRWYDGNTERSKRPLQATRLRGAGGDGRLRCANFWQDSIFIQCADGKARRVPGRVGVTYYEIEPTLFCLLSDGISAILGAVWSEGCIKLKAEVIRHAKKANARPGKVLQALWCAALQKTVQRDTRRYGTFSTTEILLIALCELAGNPQHEIVSTTPDISKIQETTLRALWENSGKTQIFTCSSYKQGLDGSQTGEPSNTLCRVPPEIAHETSSPLQSLWGQGEKTQNVPKALSEMEEIWRSIADKEVCWERKMEDCQGWCDGLTRFPLCGSFSGRVGLLRGAGNSIVPQVAAEFIKAFMEVT